MSEKELREHKIVTPEPVPVNFKLPSFGKFQKTKLWRIVGVVFLCAASGFFGAWLLLTAGWVKIDATNTLTANKQTLVLQQGEIVSQVFKEVNPSTVAITTESVPTNSFSANRGVTQSAGSGIIVSKDGYVLTNKHVVPSNSDKLTVITSDGRQFNDVKIIGRDPANDLAFLKINGASNLTPATIGDSGKVTPGQQVVAIGNALGLFRNSVTSGIISGIGRPVQAADEQTGAAEQLDNMLQTDAAINPGNSGGPLVNLKGEVIGINTAVSQDGQSIGFAIPINLAKGLVNSVTKTGKISKPYLGVRYTTLTPEIASQLGLQANDGAYVHTDGGSAVVAGGPAAKAGVQNGDIITKVNGQAVTEQSSLASQVAQFNPGDKIDVTVLRDGKERVLTIILGEFPQ